MRIILVSEYFPDSDKGDFSGGVEARCFYMAKELAKKHEVLIISSWRKGQTRNKTLAGIKIKRVGPNHGYSNKGGFVSRYRFAIAAYKAIKKEKADLVDGFNFTTYIPSYYGAKKIGAKKIATYHETWIGEWIKNKGLITGIVGEILERKTLSLKWDKIIPVSNFTKNKLRKNGVSENKLSVVYNGVIVDDFKKMKVKKEKDFTIVCVSRLIKTKRQETILKALKELNDKSIKLVLVGDGDDREYFKKRVKELKLEKQVFFTGFLKTKKDVIKEIKKSHVVCHPSAVEGFGIILIEAMAGEVPVICSNIPPLKEVSDDGKYCMIFKLDNYKELAEKIKILKEDNKKYKQMIKLGLKRVKDFDWKKITENYSKVVLK